MVAIKEGQIARKHQGTWEIIQAFLDIPANTTVYVTYTPPSGKVLLLVYNVAGSQIYYHGVISILFDGEYVVKNLRPTKCLEQLTEQYVSYPIKHKIDFYITNTDTVTHTTDFILWGFLIPFANLDAYIKEIREEDIREKMDEQIAILKDIRDWLMKTLKK